jgi:hypothetical protein
MIIHVAKPTGRSSGVYRQVAPPELFGILFILFVYRQVAPLEFVGNLIFVYRQVVPLGLSYFFLQRSIPNIIVHLSSLLSSVGATYW